jgi:predicted DNA-binding ribbon-helix-helix protein
MNDDPIYWQQSRPRILQHAGKRYAVRLEEIFWESLDALARRRHIRLGALVAGLAATYNGVNFSSYLRAYALAEARRDLVRHEASLSPFDLVDIVRNCPAPGLLIQQDRTIIDANAALLQWLGRNPPPVRLQKLDNLFEPRVSRPLNETMNLLSDGRLKRTQIQIVYTPTLLADTRPLPQRAALATLHGFHNPAGTFYCLVWLTASPALQVQNTVR